MSNNFSFYPVNKSEGSNKSEVRPITERQVQYYRDLCLSKNVKVKNYTLMNYEQLAEEIAEIKAYFPPSDKQLAIIKEKIQKLNDNGYEIKEPDYKALTGGMNGNASTLIASLIQIEQEQEITAPITEEQEKFICQMYLCPEIAFEEYEIKLRIQLEGKTWRRCTAEEFVMQLREKLTKRTASELMNKYRGIFQDWKRDRITTSQVKYINSLQDRLCNIGTEKTYTGKKGFYVSLSGDLIQNEEVVAETAKTNNSNYNRLSDLELYMFSKKQAEEFINQLKSELGRKELYRFGESTGQENTFEMLRKKNESEYSKLEELIFKLEAVAGFEVEHLHELINENMVNNIGNEEDIRNAKLEIKSFMSFLMSEQYITFGGLIALCEKSATAQEILMI